MLKIVSLNISLLSGAVPGLGRRSLDGDPLGLLLVSVSFLDDTEVGLGRSTSFSTCESVLESVTTGGGGEEENLENIMLASMQSNYTKCRVEDLVLRYRLSASFNSAA